MSINTVSEPPSDKRMERWEKIADKARRSAPKWVVVRGVSAKTATRIRNGEVAAFPNPEEWEVTTRDNTRDNRCTIYVKYTG